MNSEKEIFAMDFTEYLRKWDIAGNSKVYDG